MSSNRARQAAQGGRQSAQRAGQAGRPQTARRPRPLPKGDTLFTPRSSPGRQTMEQRSATSLLWLHQLPRWLPAAVAVALLLTGFAVRGPGGAIALGALAAALGWLAAISWPRLDSQGRALRILAIAVIVVLAIVQGMR